MALNSCSSDDRNHSKLVPQHGHLLVICYVARLHLIVFLDDMTCCLCSDGREMKNIRVIMEKPLSGTRLQH